MVLLVRDTGPIMKCALQTKNGGSVDASLHAMVKGEGPFPAQACYLALGKPP